MCPAATRTSENRPRVEEARPSPFGAPISHLLSESAESLPSIGGRIPSYPGRLGAQSGSNGTIHAPRRALRRSTPDRRDDDGRPRSVGSPAQWEASSGAVETCPCTRDRCAPGSATRNPRPIRRIRPRSGSPVSMSANRRSKRGGGTPPAPCATSQRWAAVPSLGIPSIGHSSVPTVGRVMASTISRVASGSLTHLL